AEVPLKSISFNFPVYKDGHEIQELLWDKGNTVETVVLMSRVIK
ncbi:MAG: site-specific recombinase, partial [Eubacteriaceae bacterium]|nr:site-specific recombinase [Eubacteriaceae bacterium]